MNDYDLQNGAAAGDTPLHSYLHRLGTAYSCLRALHSDVLHGAPEPVEDEPVKISTRE